MGITELVLELQADKANIKGVSKRLERYDNFLRRGKDLKLFNDDWEFV